jgi:hypothetical protein
MSKFLKFFIVLIIFFIMSTLTSWAGCDGQSVLVWGEGDSDKAIAEAKQNCCGGSVIEVHNLQTGGSTFVGVFSDGPNSTCANE